MEQDLFVGYTFHTCPVWNDVRPKCLHRCLLINRCVWFEV